MLIFERKRPLHHHFELPPKKDEKMPPPLAFAVAAGVSTGSGTPAKARSRTIGFTGKATSG